MARQTMSLGQIAARLGFTVSRLSDWLEKWPELRRAYVGGRAEGLDMVTRIIFERALAGDMQAVRLYDEHQRGRPASRVQIEITEETLMRGITPARVDVTNLLSLARNQAALLDGQEGDEFQEQAIDEARNSSR